MPLIKTKVTPSEDDKPKMSLNIDTNHETQFIEVEDFDESIDSEFVNKSLAPYLNDLYKDL